MKKIRLVFTTCVAVGFCVWYFLGPADRKSYVTTAFDPCLSIELCSQISCFLDGLRELNLPVKKQFEMVHEQFSFIKNVAAYFMPVNHIHYMFVVEKPYCMINDKYLFTTGGQLVACDVYTQKDLHDLPVVKLDEQVIQDPVQLNNVYSYIRRLSSDIFAQYHIRFVGSHAVCFTDKESPTYTLLLQPTDTPTKDLIAHCNSIKNELKEDKSLARNRWVADTRYDSQIVVYMEKRGGQYGKGVYW